MLRADVKLDWNGRNSLQMTMAAHGSYNPLIPNLSVISTVSVFLNLKYFHRLDCVSLSSCSPSIIVLLAF